MNENSIKYKTKNGIFWVSNNDKKIQKGMEKLGGHQIEEVDWLLSIIKGGKVLDIGAHVGTFSIPLSQKAEVIACEPHPGTFNLLTKNITENNANVKAHNVAIGNKGTMHLETKKNDGGSNLTNNKSGYVVNVLEMDDLYDKYELIKIDVEGFEYEAMRSGKKNLSEKPIIFFEVSKNSGILRKIKIDWLLRKYVFYRINKKTSNIEKLFSTLQVSFGDILAIPKSKKDRIKDFKRNA